MRALLHCLETGSGWIEERDGWGCLQEVGGASQAVPSFLRACFSSPLLLISLIIDCKVERPSILFFVNRETKYSRDDILQNLKPSACMNWID
jgi:hypothetical protein